MQAQLRECRHIVCAISYSVCSFPVECVLSLQNVFSCYRASSDRRCRRLPHKAGMQNVVLLLQNVFSYHIERVLLSQAQLASQSRHVECGSLATECVLSCTECVLLSYRTCSLIIQNVFSDCIVHVLFLTHTHTHTPAEPAQHSACATPGQDVLQGVRDRPVSPGVCVCVCVCVRERERERERECVCVCVCV